MLLGTGLGFLLCLVIGSIFIGMFYAIGKNHWAKTENLWEGAFGILASAIITWMGAALLRISRLQDKWRVKLEKALDPRMRTERGCWNGFQLFWEKYQMFLLPFITILREGIEMIVFVGGMSMNLPATAFPIPVITGIACGILIGYLVYR